MSKPICLVDVDGTIADTHTPWLRLYNSYHNDNLTPEDITRWEIHEFVKCGMAIYDYLVLDEIYEEAPVVPGALEGVEAIREAGFDVIFATSGFYLEKIRWLIRNKFTKSKELYAPHDVVIARDKSLVRGVVGIDDYWMNIQARQVPILYDQPWNRHIPDAFRMYNWSEIRHWLEGYAM